MNSIQIVEASAHSIRGFDADSQIEFALNPLAEEYTLVTQTEVVRISRYIRPTETWIIRNGVGYKLDQYMSKFGSEYNLIMNAIVKALKR